MWISTMTNLGEFTEYSEPTIESNQGTRSDWARSLLWWLFSISITSGSWRIQELYNAKQQCAKVCSFSWLTRWVNGTHSHWIVLQGAWVVKLWICAMIRRSTEISARTWFRDRKGMAEPDRQQDLLYANQVDTQAEYWLFLCSQRCSTSNLQMVSA